MRPHFRSHALAASALVDALTANVRHEPSVGQMNLLQNERRLLRHKPVSHLVNLSCSDLKLATEPSASLKLALASSGRRCLGINAVASALLG